jgi:recombination protein RecT
MSTNALTVLENQLKPLAPRFAEVLGKTMPVERLIRTVVLSVERLPALMDCDRQSIFNAAMSAAVLGLEVDGVTGQGYLIPFKGKAQLVIGYKGYNTLAARSGLTVTGAVVREGDAFDYELGDKGFVRHKPKLGEPGRRIVAAWAVAAAHDRPPIISVLSIDDINAIKAKSPGAKRSDSPWNDPSIGFPAMAEKSAKRRLARSMPLNVMQLAARMDEAFEEQGAAAHITPDKGLVIDGEFSPIADREPSRTPTATELISPDADAPAENIPPLPDAGSPLRPHDDALAVAAQDGMIALVEAWKAVPVKMQRDLKQRLDLVHKVEAAKDRAPA